MQTNQLPDSIVRIILALKMDEFIDAAQQSREHGGLPVAIAQ
jgi:hypothetical protein